MKQEFESYRAAIGGYPSPEELSAMLHFGDAPEWPAPHLKERIELAMSLRAAIGGGLRMAAARLLNFPKEELAGETELYFGINGLEALRAARDGSQSPR
ncbi:MAG TPA: hypothetical protein VGD10_04325 [Allosphingosinicella sp.]|uniref:hypothetical protein n=1 Tax=Allosphingosinicella sp. TaxID=2823234 RepID=UPI002ED90687